MEEDATGGGIIYKGTGKIAKSAGCTLTIVSMPSDRNGNPLFFNKAIKARFAKRKRGGKIRNGSVYGQQKVKFFEEMPDAPARRR